MHPVAGERAAGRASTGPARSRGAGSAGRGRRRGCRTPARGTCRPSPSTPGASPGRPRPHGVGQDAVSGSPGLWPFHSAKSRGSRLPRGSASSAAAHVVDPLVRQLAVLRPGPHVEVDVARAVVGRVGVAARRPARAISSTISVMWPVARGSYVGGTQPEDVVRRVQRALVGVGERQPPAARLGGLGQDLVVDVGDVGDERDLVARTARASAAGRRTRPPCGCARCAARPARSAPQR